MNFKNIVWFFKAVIGARSGVRFEIFVIEYPCDLHVNYARSNGFLRNVFYTFQNLRKALQTFSLKRTSQKTTDNNNNKYFYSAYPDLFPTRYTKVKELKRKFQEINYTSENNDKK